MLLSTCLQDVDEFFQNERDHNLVLTGCVKTAAEVRRSLIASWSVYLSSLSPFLSLISEHFPSSCRDS